MLTFFRKIRKSLIKSGAVSRYLLYGIGEIALVVIGILIALKINNWNTKIQNRNQEQQILVQLREEFNSNLDQLKDKIAFRDFLSFNNRRLLKAIDNKSTVTSLDSLDFQLAATLGIPTFDAAQGVSQELIQAGKLYLLQNDELRRSIASWESDVEQLNEEEDMFLQFSREKYTPFLIKNIRYRNIQRQFWDLQVDPIPGLPGEENHKIGLGPSQQESETLTFLKHPDLEDYLTELMVILYVANLQSQVVKEKIERILILVESSLD